MDIRNKDGKKVECPNLFLKVYKKMSKRIAKAWEWAEWLFSEKLEINIGVEITSIGIYVGHVKKPKIIQGDKCVSFFLTSAIIRSIAMTSSGVKILNEERKAKALKEILGQIEAWEGSRTKLILKRNEPIIWNIYKEPLNKSYLYDLALAVKDGKAESLCKNIRILFDGTIFKNILDIKASNNLISKKLRDCIIELEDLWQSKMPILIGCPIRDENTTLIVWINLDIPQQFDQKYLKKIIKDLCNQYNDRFLLPAKKPDAWASEEISILYASNAIRNRLDEILSLNDEDLIINGVAKIFKKYLYSDTTRGEKITKNINKFLVSSIPLDKTDTEYLHIYRHHYGIKDCYLDDKELIEEIKHKLIKSLNRVRSHIRERVALNDKLHLVSKTIGKNDALAQVFNLVEKVASIDSPVLITGENGTGKEIISRAIHDMSPRRNRPFVVVDCAALTPSVIESELFGHEKGSFTGADKIKHGKLEIAEDGTIFIDEIGELPLDIQGKFLRFIQQREYQRVGGNSIRKVKARIITATNRDLKEMVNHEKFRMDLFYRITSTCIELPSLRERPKKHIEDLVHFFIDNYNRKIGKNVKTISPDAIDLLLSHTWPGNVRELENCIQNAILICNDNIINSEHIILQKFNFQSNPVKKDFSPIGSIKQDFNPINSTNKDDWLSLSEIERFHVINALKKSKFNRTNAAKKLKVTYNQLRGLIKKHKIDVEKIKTSTNHDRGYNSLLNSYMKVQSDEKEDVLSDEFSKLAFIIEEERNRNIAICRGIDSQNILRTRHFHSVIQNLKFMSEKDKKNPEIELCEVYGKNIDQKIVSKMESKPSTSILISDFCISKYPITNRQYKDFIDQTGHPYPENWLGGHFSIDEADNPVTGITWADVVSFCDWISNFEDRQVSIPTLWQWLLASGYAFDERIYPWGNEWISDSCNSKEFGYGKALSVHRFESENISPFGCVDMLGNVWEWTTTPIENLSPHEFPWRSAVGGAFNIKIRDKGFYSKALCCPGHFIQVRDLGFRIVVSN